MTRTDRLDALSNAIAACATKRAAIAARRGRESRGYYAAFSLGAQRAYRIGYPVRVTTDDREIIAASLRALGFTVDTNTRTDAKGRTTFVSYTVRAA